MPIGFATQRCYQSYKKAAFNVHMLDVDRWDRLTIERSKLKGRFAEFPDEDLLINGFDVLFRPAGQG
jgi:hypothetical protein